MRVAVVTENFLPKLDGVTRTLAMLLEHLRHRGHRAVLFGPDGGPRHYAGARIIGAPGIPLPLYPELRALFPPPELPRELAQFQPDVVHVVEPMLLGAAGIFWAKRLGLPVLSSYHTNLAAYCAHYGLGALEASVWAYRRFLHDQTALTLCPSPSTLARLERQGFTNLRVWARGVDTSLFTPARRSADWRTRVAGPSPRLIILYVGRLSHEKNLDALATSYAALKDERVHLVLVGDGPARAALEARLAGRRVTFTGYLSGTELAEAYASADLFAFPSLTETFGQVVQEAMASGLPIVAFAAEGVRDQVRDGETGMLVAPGDTAAFAAAMRALVHAPERRAALGERARSVALGRTWDHVMDELLSLYAAVAARELPTRAA